MPTRRISLLLALVIGLHAAKVQHLQSSLLASSEIEASEHGLILLQDEDYPQLSGDTQDNDETDSTSLILVSPSSDTDRVSWSDDVYDGDEAEYQDDVEDSDNPAVSQTSLMQVDNPLDRDEGELPDDNDDSEDDAVDGDFFWLLVTSFTADKAGSGQVHAVPDEDSEDDKFVLISGLDKPVGLCFDQNHDFLYVADPTYGDEGYIYQFSIDWDDDDTFELATTDYTIVYRGPNPYSCWVDQYGNLYFVDASENQVNMIVYLDLWTGFTNYYYTLYSNDDDSAYFSTPVGINVYDSQDIYIVNHVPNENAHTLIKADAQVKGNNSGQVKQKALTKEGAWGVAVSDDYVYFTTKDSVLWVMEKDDKNELTTKDSKYLVDPRGVCYGDDDIYVADFGRGLVLEYDDNDDQEDNNDDFIEIEGAYAVYCVNSAVGFTAAFAALLLMN